MAMQFVIACAPGANFIFSTLLRPFANRDFRLQLRRLPEIGLNQLKGSISLFCSPYTEDESVTLVRSTGCYDDHVG